MNVANNHQRYSGVGFNDPSLLQILEIGNKLQVDMIVKNDGEYKFIFEAWK